MKKHISRLGFVLAIDREVSDRLSYTKEQELINRICTLNHVQEVQGSTICCGIVVTFYSTISEKAAIAQLENKLKRYLRR